MSFPSSASRGTADIVLKIHMAIGQELCIAIVEDDESLRNVLQRLLSALEYRVECYASAREFLHAAVKSEATCLLIDVELGAASGVNMVRELYASGSKPPVIFMSGSTDEAIRRRCTEFGCAAFLRKPFTAIELIGALASVHGPSPGTPSRT